MQSRTAKRVVLGASPSRVSDPDARVGKDVMKCLMAPTEVHGQERKDAQQGLQHKTGKSLMQRNVALSPIIGHAEVHGAMANGASQAPDKNRLI